jgi:hypothetical protein
MVGQAMDRMIQSVRTVPMALFLLLTLASGQQKKSPSFQDYRVATVHRGPSKPPTFGNVEQFSGTDLRCFGGDPAAYAREQANFAGHYVIASCTCGSGCHYLFMWDALTGKFYDRLPFGRIEVGPFGLNADLPPVEYKGEQYRSDSRLLIIESCVEDTCDCAKRYLVWNDQQFQLVLKQPVRLPPNCLK